MMTPVSHSSSARLNLEWQLELYNYYYCIMSNALSSSEPVTAPLWFLIMLQVQCTDWECLLLQATRDTSSLSIRTLTQLSQ
jgi:hypothetical protein